MTILLAGCHKASQDITQQQALGLHTIDYDTPAAIGAGYSWPAERHTDG